MKVYGPGSSYTYLEGSHGCDRCNWCHQDNVGTPAGSPFPHKKDCPSLTIKALADALAESEAASVPPTLRQAGAEPPTSQVQTKHWTCGASATGGSNLPDVCPVHGSESKCGRYHSGAVVGPAFSRERFLAREQAFMRHARYVLEKNTQGHIQGMNDTEWGFSACPHPDCKLFSRAEPVAAPSPQTALSDAHVWELERLLTKLRGEDAGNFPLIQAIEAAIQQPAVAAPSPQETK